MLRGRPFCQWSPAPSPGTKPGAPLEPGLPDQENHSQRPPSHRPGATLVLGGRGRRPGGLPSPLQQHPGPGPQPQRM
eukprot:588001-Pyramimonas_sp.AAC.1